MTNVTILDMGAEDVAQVQETLAWMRTSDSKAEKNLIDNRNSLQPDD